MDKATVALLRENLGDVTAEEYDAFMAAEAEAIEAIIARCDFALGELAAEYKTFVKVSRTYYMYIVPVLVIDTYKKLRPAASEKEKKAIFFAAWLPDWIACVNVTICDICDGKDERAGQATVPAQLGAANTMRLYWAVMNNTYDLVEETCAGEPYLLQLLRICRSHVKEIMLSQMIDTSCVKYDRRRDPKWYQVREYTSSTAPCFVFPLEVAFCVAQETMDSEIGRASLELAKLMGAFFRNIDDVLDLESDTLAGRLNWAFWPAWAKANDEQREIMLGGSSNGLNKESAAKLVQLYGDLDMKKEFEAYMSQTLKSLAKLLDQSPDQIPSKAWKAIPEFYRKLYSGAAGLVNFHDHDEMAKE